MKNKELLNLYEVLNNLNLKGAKFAYAIAKNIALIKTEVESLQKAVEMSDEYKEFDGKRIELAKKHAKKDDKGEPILKDNSYQLEDKEAFNKEWEALKEENKELVESREQQLKDFNELLEKENDIKFHKISIKDIPEEISSQQMTQIFDLVSED